MAATLVLSPQAPSAMTSRRQALADIPHAINSPNRGLAALAPKRARSHAADQRESAYGQPPPTKKQLLQTDEQEARRNALLQKTSNQPPTTFQQKLEAVRDARQPAKPTEKRPQQANLEDIRQWQRHYRKVFPQIVFYFDNVPEETRERIKRQVKNLGSTDETFFSKVVTHVVTTRPIPADINSSASNSAGIRSPPSKHELGGQGRTINPLLLETQQTRYKFTFEAPLQRKVQVQHAGQDILHKAKTMGCKIWKLEKLERMINTMYNTETGEQVVQSLNPRQAATTRKDAELSQLLQHEKKHGAADQQWMSDMVPFRGLYIYVHDMNEVTRPVMMRDYPKPPTKEEGKWPQLRVNAAGRCPFIDEPEMESHVSVTETRRPANEKCHTRAASAATQATKMEKPSPTETSVLKENNNLAKRNRTVSTRMPHDQNVAKPLDPPKMPLKRGSTDTLPLFGSAQASLRRIPRFAGGEPIASGVQPSNVTSAIKSQMISSTAAAPGTKAGMSKELNVLKRKVLERNNMPTTYLNDVRAAINNDGAGMERGIKRKADALTYIHEEETVVSDEAQPPRRKASVSRKKSHKESKPGYCENCHEKFNDFDEHIVSRKHRKFALDNENWKELDWLLADLVRPLRG